MTKHRVTLDETLLEDLKKVVDMSPLLVAAYEALPEEQREAVEDKFLDLIWDMILVNANGRLYDGKPDRSVLTPILMAAMGKPKK